MATRMGERQHCATCGEEGHKTPRHRATKSCGRCRQELPTSEFYIARRQQPNGRVKQQFSSICRACNTAYGREAYSKSAKTWLKNRLGSARRRAHREGWCFNLDLDFLEGLYLQQKGKCFYSGLLMAHQSGSDAISIDRRAPTEGYVKGNIVLTCWRVNNIKRDSTEGDFLSLCRSIANWRK